MDMDPIKDHTILSKSSTEPQIFAPLDATTEKIMTMSSERELGLWIAAAGSLTMVIGGATANLPIAIVGVALLIIGIALIILFPDHENFVQPLPLTISLDPKIDPRDENGETSAQIQTPDTGNNKNPISISTLDDSAAATTPPQNDGTGQIPLDFLESLSRGRIDLSSDDLTTEDPLTHSQLNQELDEWDLLSKSEIQAPEWNNIQPDLFLFSRLPRNTDVHISRDGRFVQTAGPYAAIPGAQTAANLYKGHTPEQLVIDLAGFTKKILGGFNELCEKLFNSKDDDIKVAAFRDVFLAYNELQQAIHGMEKDGGMIGLLKTYPNDPIHANLQLSINNLEEQSSKLFKKCQTLFPQELPLTYDEESLEKLPYCPEEFFQDDNWEKAIAASSQLKPESVGLGKYYGFYSTALAFTQANVTSGKWNWWDKIIQFENGASLYLGALPLQRGFAGQTWRNDLDDIKKLDDKGVAVLSVTEVFENNSEGWIGSPIKSTEWKNAGVKQLQLPTPDFETIPIDMILRGVEYIHWNISNGRSVYVHCKAGRGRSALVMMCYLMKYQRYTAEDAFKLIRSQRKQAGFKEGDAKMKTLRKMEALIKAGS